METNCRDCTGTRHHPSLKQGTVQSHCRSALPPTPYLLRKRHRTLPAHHPASGIYTAFGKPSCLILTNSSCPLGNSKLYCNRPLCSCSGEGLGACRNDRPHAAITSPPIMTPTGATIYNTRTKNIVEQMSFSPQKFVCQIGRPGARFTGTGCKYGNRQVKRMRKCEVMDADDVIA